MQIFKTTTISIFHFPSMMNFIWPPKTLLGHCHLMEFLLSAIYHQSKPAEFSGHRPRHVSSWWSYFSLIYCAATIFFTCHYLVAALLWLSSLLCTARFLLWQLLTSTLNMEDPGKSRIWSQVLLLVQSITALARTIFSIICSKVKIDWLRYKTGISDSCVKLLEVLKDTPWKYQCSSSACSV